MRESNTHAYVGMDVHQESVTVAMLQPGKPQPVMWKFTNEPKAIRKFARKLRQQTDGKVYCCYEAGPTGYVIQRILEEEDVPCDVVAPSLIPFKPGDHIKTDRRDARKLAELLRAGMLTPVHPPTPEDEAVRDLCRCRTAAQGDLKRSQNRLTRFLARRGLVFREGNRWTGKHHAWLRRIRLEHPADQAILDDSILVVEQQQQRLQDLDAKIEEIAQTEPYREKVGWLRCFRGIDTLTAMIVLAEVHDFRRFPSPEKLMSYLGLVPREHSSGTTLRRGTITKSGNSHVRRILVEAAWHYRYRPTVGKRLAARRTGQPQWAIALADSAQRRLFRRFHHLELKGNKAPGKAATAVARELVGFLWMVMCIGDQRPDRRAA